MIDMFNKLLLMIKLMLTMNNLKLTWWSVDMVTNIDIVINKDIGDRFISD